MQLLRDFSSLFDWFVDNKLSMHLSQDNKTNFNWPFYFYNAQAINIVYSGTEMKQYAKLKYLGYILDPSISCESMTLNVTDKVNSRLKFIHKQYPFLAPL